MADRLLGSLGMAALAALGICMTAGCSSAAYYAQAVAGHWSIVRAARPVSEWLADERTDAPLRARLELSQRLRDYAVAELKEPDNASYRRYADLKRPAAVWNVVAAPELGLKLQTWCFPVVGCVGYRGYYDPADAEAFAASLRLQGLEAVVYPVPAYSTLGWLPGRMFADPLLNTFIGDADSELAGLIFHELAHQIAFAPGDTMFNESFATAVEHIGVERWLGLQADAALRSDHERRELRRRDFRELTLRFRDRLDALYAGTASETDKRQAKAALMAELRAEYVVMKRERWGGYAGYDGWFARANNASFGVLAAYNELVPNFERLFEREQRDFGRFYSEVGRLAGLPFAERRHGLP